MPSGASAAGRSSSRRNGGRTGARLRPFQSGSSREHRGPASKLELLVRHHHVNENRSSGRPSNCNRAQAPAAKAVPPRTEPQRNDNRLHASLPGLLTGRPPVQDGGQAQRAAAMIDRSASVRKLPSLARAPFEDVAPACPHLVLAGKIHIGCGSADLVGRNDQPMVEAVAAAAVRGRGRQCCTIADVLRLRGLESAGTALIGRRPSATPTWHDLEISFMVASCSKCDLLFSPELQLT